MSIIVVSMQVRCRSSSCGSGTEETGRLDVNHLSRSQQVGEGPQVSRSR